MVLAGERVLDATAATQVVRRRRLRKYEPPKRGRPLWPWLLGLGLVLAVLVGGWLALDSIQRPAPGQPSTVAVPYVVGHPAGARGEPDHGSRPRPAGTAGLELGRRGGHRLRAEPDRGHEGRQGRRSSASTSRPASPGDDPERRRPEHPGRRRGADASRARRPGRRGELGPRPGHGDRAVAERRAPWSSRARASASTSRRARSPSRSRTSSGSRTTRRRRSSSQKGFGVSRIDEESDQAAGIVTDQDPSGGSEGSKGSTVTLTVSKGPSTAAVPDVTTQDVSIAQTTLDAAGFRTRVVLEDTDDPTQRRDRHVAGPGRRHAGQAELARHPLRRTLRQRARPPPRRRLRDARASASRFSPAAGRASTTSRSRPHARSSRRSTPSASRRSSSRSTARTLGAAQAGRR